MTTLYNWSSTTERLLITWDKGPKFWAIGKGSLVMPAPEAFNVPMLASLEIALGIDTCSERIYGEQIFAFPSYKGSWTRFASSQMVTFSLQNVEGKQAVCSVQLPLKEAHVLAALIRFCVNPQCQVHIVRNIAEVHMFVSPYMQGLLTSDVIHNLFCHGLGFGLCGGAGAEKVRFYVGVDPLSKSWYLIGPGNPFRIDHSVVSLPRVSPHENLATFVLNGLS